MKLRQIQSWSEFPAVVGPENKIIVASQMTESERWIFRFVKVACHP
jgi:hypothetical protein